MNPAVIVGNGPSRGAFRLDPLSPVGPIFACNAAYRGQDPDLISFLVAFDEKMVMEIKGSDFPLDKLIVPSLEEQYEPAAANPNRPRNNAGMVAMNEAIKRGYDDLLCVGMDFILEDPALNVGNLYDGTNAYGPETRASYEDTKNRCRYLEWFVDQHPTVKFRFLFEKSYERPVRVDKPNIRIQFI